MSTLAHDIFFDFTFPPCDPTTPPSFCFDPSLLELPANLGHSRSSSHASISSFESSSSPSGSFTSCASTADSVLSSASAVSRRTRPSRSPIRTHGPLLLPRIRSQDQAIAPSNAVVTPARPAKRARTSPVPAAPYRPTHMRSFTNPESISFESPFVPPTLGPPISFAGEDSTQITTPYGSRPGSPLDLIQQQDAMAMHAARRASSCSLDSSTIEKFGFPTYRQMPSFLPPTTSCTTGIMSTTTQAAPLDVFSRPEAFLPQPSYLPRASSPLANMSMALAPIPMPAPVPEPTPSMTLLSYLTSVNPAPSLVHTISFPLRDPHTKHFWWDVRQIRPWAGFSVSTIMALPGASLLTMPVPTHLFPALPPTQRHPETESALQSTYATHYLPKLNAALALSSPQPLQLSLPTRSSRILPPVGCSSSPSSSSSTSTSTSASASASASSSAGCAFVAHAPGDASSAAALFGGKPTARVVGLVKSFDRFNTGMRAEGNIKRVEYLRGLAHLHHVMREHGCRYGFVLTEIELVVVRNGAERTPHFGYLEVASVQLADAHRGGEDLVALLGAGAAEGLERDGSGGGEKKQQQQQSSTSKDSSSGADNNNKKKLKLTACLALWGLCMLASDEVVGLGADPSNDNNQNHAAGLGQSQQQQQQQHSKQPHWRSDIGAPAEGTRRKTLPRDDWMPQPQLAEKREAKRARGWVWPEDAIGRKELGRRGVRYGAGSC